MPRLTNWLAKTAFGIGCTIGVLLGPCVVPALQNPALAGGAARMDPPQCTVAPSVPQEIRDWVGVLCAVHAAIFADDTEPSVCYTFESAITQSGTYNGLNHTGRAVSFEAAFVVQDNFKDDAPDLDAMGVDACLVIGRLSGSGGSTPIQGALIRPGDLTADEGYLLMVTSIITAQQLDLYATISRILAGPRVVNTATGDTFPLSELQSAQWLSAYESDLATLYCGCGSSFGPGGGGVDPNCVKNAYDAFDLAVAAARTTAANCLKNATSNLAGCLGLCALATIGSGGIGWFVGVVCGAICLAVYADNVDTCMQALYTALSLAIAQLALALAACGVLIVQD